MAFLAPQSCGLACRKSTHMQMSYGRLQYSNAGVPGATCFNPEDRANIYNTVLDVSCMPHLEWSQALSEASARNSQDT